MNALIDILNKGTDYLSSKGVEDARRTMELLLAHILECDRLSLYMRHDEPISEEKLFPLRQLMQKKAEGFPLQHLLGYVDFYGRSFKSDKRALIPRPETEELIEHIFELYKKEEKPLPRCVLDMGTGSGVIGITVALECREKGVDVELTLVDISEEALSLALENAIAHRVKVEARRGDLFEALAESDEPPQFNLILANLPYIALSDESELSREVKCDPALALYGGEQGVEVIVRFLEQAMTYLAPGGVIGLEVGWDQGDFVKNLMKKLGYSDVLLLSDVSGIERFPLAKAPRLG